MYVRILGRHWLAALLWGTFGAVACAGMVWLIQTPTYSAVALLQIAVREPSLVLNDPLRSTDDDFRVYKRTQQRLLLSLGFLNNAIGQRDVAELGLIRRSPDAAAWLASKLDVTFPDDAEIMRIGLEGKNPRELAPLLNGLIRAYLEQVARNEGKRHDERLRILDRVYADKEGEIRQKRGSMCQLLEQVQARNRFLPSPTQQLAEALRLDMSLHLLQGELKTRHESLANSDGRSEADPDLLTAVRADPLASQLNRELVQMQQAAAYTAEVAGRSAAPKFAAEAARKLDTTQQKLLARIAELQSNLSAARQAQAAADARKLRDQIAALADARQQIESDLLGQRKRLEEAAQSPVDIQRAIDVEMLRAEIDRLDALLQRVAEDRVRLTVDYRAGSRITLVQPATILANGNSTLRLIGLTLAMLVGLAFPAICVIWHETPQQQVVSPGQVTEELGLDVLGAFRWPGARRKTLPGGPDSQNPAFLAGGIDALVVMLLRQFQLESDRMLLISSAQEDEARTTLATQLALGLTRIGKRVLLVDASLHQPQLHALFGLPQEPGLCEVLRAEHEVLDVLQETAIENLALVSAGHWDSQAYRQLSCGTAEHVLDQCRAVYDFVIVDAGPVLQATEACLLAQHADLALLSVLCYASRVPQIQKARETLTAMGVARVVAVVADPRLASPSKS